MENLFSLDDLYLYRSVVMFYAGRYSESISDLIESKRAKKMNKFIDNQNSAEMGDSESETDYVDFKVASFDELHVIDNLN